MILILTRQELDSLVDWPNDMQHTRLTPNKVLEMCDFIAIKEQNDTYTIIKRDGKVLKNSILATSLHDVTDYINTNFIQPA